MIRPAATRRDVLALGSLMCLGALSGRRATAQDRLPVRRIPGSDESLPVIGLGSSKIVSEIAANGTAPVAAVLRALVAQGGRVVDTWPRDAGNDAGFGNVINLPDLRDALFVTTKIDVQGRDAGIAQFEATLRNYGRRQVDLAQIFSLTDLYTHWPSLKDWKQDGRARYIGVTVAEDGLYEELERFLGREQPDFIQLNYSITERRAEERLLPLARDKGLAVLINRPFMNGVYFRRLEGQALPAWAQEFGCTTWAEFSLKYILANPSLTCVLTETSNPDHMVENTMAALGQMPNEAQRARMRELIDRI
jgi:diketogulonate reductase-like aldo/keto reductase